MSEDNISEDARDIIVKDFNDWLKKNKPQHDYKFFLNDLQSFIEYRVTLQEQTLLRRRLSSNELNVINAKISELYVLLEFIRRRTET